MVMIKESPRDKLFNIVNITILTIILIIVLYPLVYIISASVSDPALVATGQMWLFPKGLTIEGYKRLLQDSEILTGYYNTIIYTVVGTFLNLTFTLTAAFALSKKRLFGYNVLMFLIAFTMYFSGGMIPTYLLIKNLHMLNTFWVMVIPGLVNTFNLIIARTFYINSVPGELEEAAMIDGCSVIRTFLSIILPLSKAIIAVMALYYGVAHWNAYFGAMIYLTDRSKFPLQLILREILVQYQMQAQMLNTMGGDETLDMQVKLASIIRYAVIVVSSLPVIIVYPFIQKYFAKGVMIGALKG